MGNNIFTNFNGITLSKDIPRVHVVVNKSARI